jgi:hypothetical protein
MIDHLSNEEGKRIIAELAELLPNSFRPKPSSNMMPFEESIIEIAARTKWDPVFTGGGIVGMLVTDPAAPPPSHTKDVDLVLEIANYQEFIGMEDSLRRLGFTKGQDETASIYAWRWNGVRVDFLPHIELPITGKCNRWFPRLIEEAERAEVLPGRYAWRASAPCFLATKIEAFYSRGRGDFLGSKDIEDIIAVVDGREELMSEMRYSSHDIRGFVSQSLRELINNESFRDSLPQHITDVTREKIIEDRIRALSNT